MAAEVDEVEVVVVVVVEVEVVVVVVVVKANKGLSKSVLKSVWLKKLPSSKLGMEMEVERDRDRLPIDAVLLITVGVLITPAPPLLLPPAPMPPTE